jgi:hypothetical protein
MGTDPNIIRDFHRFLPKIHDFWMPALQDFPVLGVAQVRPEWMSRAIIDAHEMGNQNAVSHSDIQSRPYSGPFTHVAEVADFNRAAMPKNKNFTPNMAVVANFNLFAMVLKITDICRRIDFAVFTQNALRPGFA